MREDFFYKWHRNKSQNFWLWWWKWMLVTWEQIQKNKALLEVWKSCEPTFGLQKSTIAEDLCHLSGRFRGLAYNNCNLNSRRAHSSVVPILFSQIFRVRHSSISWEVSYYDHWEWYWKKEENLIAKASEDYISVKKGCLECLNSYRYLDANLNKLSKTKKSFPFLDANGMKDELFRRKIAYPYEEDQTIEVLYEPL